MRRLVWLAAWLAWPGGAAADAVADNMLLLQTPSGGWSKHYQGKAVDYGHAFDAAERAALRDPARPDEATIDNKATTTEIAYLAEAYARERDARYLDGARRGVEYLLAAQYPNGGWPQFHPDHSSYRHLVTFNDDAMTRVLDLLQDIVESKGALAALHDEFGARAGAALARGLACVLATQVTIDGELTIWAAQYDEHALQPAKARAFEPAALATSESVGVVRLLMRQRAPSPRTKAAIEAAVRWFQRHRLPDLATRRIETPAGPDRVVEPAPGASLWARFYDLQRQQPLFGDRDGSAFTDFGRMSPERRAGYAWYGTWPQKLLEHDWPRWRARHAGMAEPEDGAPAARR
ncbi:pectate lyase [[Pseudomonas] boreopolis]|uniref:pectate lyase n=1 Tax=Xanthomonas boreopolis TaxID=86183 RepID=UPI003D9ADACF